MAKYQTRDGQLLLNLCVEVVEKKEKVEDFPRRSVVSFADASVLAIRRDAIERVQASGIFPSPKVPRIKA
ncbi:hypothetical protein [Labrys neptuniae]